MRNIKCRNCAQLRNDWCDKKKDSPDLDLVRDCPHYRTRTNRDVLSRMTDEQLAVFMTAITKKSAEKLCEQLKPYVGVDLNVCDFDRLAQTHLDWLRAEATNE